MIHFFRSHTKTYSITASCGSKLWTDTQQSLMCAMGVLNKCWANLSKYPYSSWVVSIAFWRPLSNNLVFHCARPDSVLTKFLAFLSSPLILCQVKMIASISVCFSLEMYPLQNAAWTQFLASQGRAKLYCNEKGVMYNKISSTQTRICEFIDFSWRKPINEFYHRKILPKAMKKIQLLL